MEKQKVHISRKNLPYSKGLRYCSHGLVGGQRNMGHWIIEIYCPIHGIKTRVRARVRKENIERKINDS